MASLLRFLNKPEYMFRPRAIFRRTARALRLRKTSNVRKVVLPWDFLSRSIRGSLLERSFPTAEREHDSSDERPIEIEVATTTLDAVLGQYNEPVGVLKIDIEGHERSVFSASQKSLLAGKVRDIIFEDSCGIDSG